MRFNLCLVIWFGFGSMASGQIPMEERPRDAEALPAAPKSTATAEHKELNKEKTLLLEMVPGKDGKKVAKRLLFATEVSLREGPLEVLVCKNNTKEHESILRTDIDARFLHAGLLTLGAKPGKPVQFFDATTQKPEYKPASGAPISVGVHYQWKGKTYSHAAQDWILDVKTKKPMAHTWVFAGSKFMKNPEKPNDPEYYCANNGEVIAISNFVDSMLDIPVEVSASNDDLTFTANTEKIPPRLSRVWVVLELKEEKK